MKMISSLEALSKIEDIVSDDFSEDISSDLMLCKLETEKEQILATKLGQIFRIAHAWNPEHSCFSVHEDWRNEFKTVEETP